MYEVVNKAEIQVNFQEYLRNFLKEEGEEEEEDDEEEELVLLSGSLDGLIWLLIRGEIEKLREILL